MAAAAALQSKISPLADLLAAFVEEADHLLRDAEGDPSQYAALSEALNNESRAAEDSIVDAPANDPAVQSLRETIAAARDRAPILSDRAKAWDEFVAARDDADAELESLRQPHDQVLAKPLRSADEVSKDLDNITTASTKLPLLGEKLKNLQRLSELLDPLESAYADVRFLDVDAEQTQKQYDDLLADLSNELEEERLLIESADQVANEIAAIAGLVAQLPGREALNDITAHQLPPLEAQLSLLQEKHDAATHARKHVAPSERVAALRAQVDNLKANVTEAAKKADEDEEARLVLLLRINLEQLQSKPVEQLTEEELQLLDNNLGKVPAALPEAQAIREQLHKLQEAKKAREAQVANALEELKKIEDDVNALVPPQPKKSKKGKKQQQPAEETSDVLQARLDQAKEISPRLQQVDEVVATSDPVLQKRIEDVKQKLADIEHNTADALNKQLADAADRKQAEDALNDYDQTLRDALVAANDLPSTSDAINALKNSITPVLDDKRSAVATVPSDLEDRRKTLYDEEKRLNDLLDSLLADASAKEDSARDLAARVAQIDDYLQNVGEKYQQQPQGLPAANQDLSDLRNTYAELEAIPVEEAPQEVNNLKEKAKDLIVAIDKVVPNEEKLRDQETQLLSAIADIEGRLGEVEKMEPAQKSELLDAISSNVEQTKRDADEHDELLAKSANPIVSHADLAADIPQKLAELQKSVEKAQADAKEAVAVSTIAPEIKIISEAVQMQADQLPTTLPEQQEALGDMEERRRRLEELIAGMPEGAGTEEIRQQSQFDLDRLKSILGQLGAAVGDKLAALAAFGAARTAAEDELLAITSRQADDNVPSTVEEMAKDEDRLAKLEQDIAALDTEALDEPQQKERDDLLSRIRTALDLLQVRFLKYSKKLN